MKYIAYYRKSPGGNKSRADLANSLSLDAQQSAVASFIGGSSLQAEYTDIESGKNNNRPELIRALAHCKATGATLVIAKLDRLSRNVAFIASLMDAKVKFKCCDMPEADNFTIHIFAALAQKEREMISTRTIAALKALKARGIVLGKPENFSREGRMAGVATLKRRAAEKKENSRASSLIRLLRGKGTTLKEIADHLNSHGFTASKGGAFTATQVMRLV